MQNKIPKAPEAFRRPRGGAVASPAGASRSGAEPRTADQAVEASTVVAQAVDRSLEGRRAAAQDEIERLIAAAFRVIERKGELEPKVSDILREAGLSNQAFYRHFRSKRELLVAVLDEGIRGLGRYLALRMSAAESPELAVREWIRGMAAQAQDPNGAQASRPFALARGHLAEAFPVEVGRSVTQITAPLRAALAKARDLGRLPATDPNLDSEALYHMMMGWVEARLIEGRAPEAREVARLEAIAMAGLRAAAVDVPDGPVLRDDGAQLSADRWDGFEGGGE